MQDVVKDALKLDTLKAVLAELVGTFFLTLAALLAGTPYAVGLVLAALVYAIGAVSGCHINPAVTAGLMAARQIPVVKGLFYILAQFLGALIAAFTSFAVGTPLPDYKSGSGLGEFLGAGLLVFVVMAVVGKQIPIPASGVAVGAALAAALLTTGGILNPAVAFAMSETLSSATWATILGGIAFALLYRLLAPESESEESEQPQEDEAQSAPSKPDFIQERETRSYMRSGD